MKLISKIANDRKSFTLIELLMTIVVVAIIAIPLALLVGEHLNSILRSEEYTMAVDLARFEMENVKNLNYANIITGSFPNYQGYSFDVTRTVSFAQGNGASAESLKLVQVDVSRAGSVTILFTLETYIAQNVIYGL